MSEKLPISVTIITRNEESRIEAAIQSVLSFAQEVIVVDSESTDETVRLAQNLKAKVVVRPFAGFGQQKNFAHSLAAADWVLNIDADERVSPELEAEFRHFFTGPKSQKIDAVYLPRKTWYLNRWIMHGGWYPNYLLRLARKEKSKWTEPPIHESLEARGKLAYFKCPLLHFSFPDQRAHVLKNVEYAAHAKIILRQKGKQPTVLDFTFRPVWKFLDAYFFKAGFLDGAAGFFIAIHSAYATFLRYTYLYEETAQNTHP